MEKDVRNLIDDLYAQADKIKTKCPTEILRLFKYQIVPSNMGGVWEQAFTTMVFAEGDMRAMNAYMLFPICRMVDREESKVEHLKSMFKETVPLSAEFCATCGLESVWEYVKKIMAVLDRVNDKSDFKELIEAFTAYQTNYHNWIHFYFPWYTGEIFQLRKKEDVAEMAKMMGI